jgi:hypothetical protein
MNIEKYNMVERQLICRDIREPQLIGAFLNVDREDYVPSRYKKLAYSDMDIAIGNDETFMLRVHTLSKIAQRMFYLDPEKLLIVGDNTSYTTSVLQYIFHDRCYSLSEEDFLHSEIEKFDLIFFDSKIYSKTTIKHGRFMLEDSGRMIFFVRSVPLELFDFSRKISFVSVDVIEKTHDSMTSKLFSTNVFLREK